MKKYYLIISTLIILSPLTCLASGRGVWYWGNETNPYGATVILTDTAKQDDVIATCIHYNITRVYGSYNGFPKSNPEAMAAWNRKLHANNIESDLLISDSNSILPTNRPELLAQIKRQLIDFNASRSDSVEKFDGLHLDLEPHVISDWSTHKKEYLNDLKDTYAEISVLLKGNNLNLPIAADIPVWFDGSSIGWTDDAERDQWFKDITSSVNSLTLMAYERKDLSSIKSGTDYERQFKSEIGLDLQEIGSTWPTLDDAINMTVNLETNLGADVAWHHLAILVPYYLDFKKSQVVVAPAPVVSNNSGGGGGYSNPVILNSPEPSLSTSTEASSTIVATSSNQVIASSTANIASTTTVATTTVKAVINPKQQKIYYLNPLTHKKYFINNADDILKIIKSQGKNIKTSDLVKIPIADKKATAVERKKFNVKFAKTKAGQILLENGNLNRAWYVYPPTATRYFLGSKLNAYQIWRKIYLK